MDVSWYAVSNDNQTMNWDSQFDDDDFSFYIFDYTPIGGITVTATKS